MKSGVFSEGLSKSVKVAGLVHASAAERAGVRKSDEIIQINHVMVKVNELGAVRKLLEALGDKDAVQLTVVNAGQTLVVNTPPE